MELKPGGIELSVNFPVSVNETHGAAAMLPITQFFAMRMKRRGVEMRLIIGGADAPPRKPDAALLKAIARPIGGSRNSFPPRTGNEAPAEKVYIRDPKAQGEALRGLLTDIGYADALLARELPDGRLMIIDGHLRAEVTPDTEVPVLVLDVTEEEADTLLLTIDPLAAMAESDSRQIQRLLETVRTDNEAVEHLFRLTAGERLWAIVHPDQFNSAEVPLERADELREKWRTEVGQLWQLGRHRLLCGDSTESDRGETSLGRRWSACTNDLD